MFNNYFSFGDGVVFSWLTFSFIVLPVIMIFPLIYFMLLLLKGEECAFKKMDAYVAYLKWGCIALVVMGVLYSVLYPTVLVKKGYLQCNGIPSGWMPGTATHYVRDSSLCNVSDK
jgi:Mn2+/Fe2+ NRAMP family transporter